MLAPNRGNSVSNFRRFAESLPGETLFILGYWGKITRFGG